MTNNLTQILDEFRGNRDRAKEEGRFGNELPTLYANGVKTRIYNNLGDQRYGLKTGKTNELCSYIGVAGEKCYLITPITADSKDPIQTTNELGEWMLKVLETGMPVQNSATMILSSGNKFKGTTLGVDNDAPVTESSDKKLIVNPIEQTDGRFGTNYLAFEISSPVYSAWDIKEVLYRKFYQLQPPALKGKVTHKIGKINSEELNIFLKN